MSGSVPIDKKKGKEPLTYIFGQSAHNKNWQQVLGQGTIPNILALKIFNNVLAHFDPHLVCEM